MCKYNGKPVIGKEFFNLLYGDQEFCAQLGRTLLAASRLESELKLYLKAHNVPLKSKYPTLGRLNHLLKEHNLLLKMQPPLEMLVKQRNYLAHSLFDLFTVLIDETVLSRTNLLDLDVYMYIERARQLEENINGFSDIIAKQRKAGK